jgi:hypothetical protein
MQEMRTIALGLVVAALAFAPSGTYAQTRIELDRVMSTEELSRTGMSKLSAEERHALEQWLERYTSTVAVAARSLGPETQTVLRTHRFPAEGARITRVVDGGSVLELDDGTRWQVFLGDRPLADGWDAGEFVRIERLALAHGDFGFVLVHGADRDRATARFVGWTK